METQGNTATRVQFRNAFIDGMRRTLRLSPVRPKAHNFQIYKESGDWIAIGSDFKLVGVSLSNSVRPVRMDDVL